MDAMPALVLAVAGAARMTAVVFDALVLRAVHACLQAPAAQHACCKHPLPPSSPWPPTCQRPAARTVASEADTLLPQAGRRPLGAVSGLRAEVR